MAGLAAGRLRERLAIQRHNVVDNGRGGRRVPDGEAEWEDVATVRAEVIALRGDEALDHLVQRAKQLWRITIRRRSGVRPSMRVAWTDPVSGHLIGNIRSAALNETRDGIVMTVETGVAA